MNIDRRLKAILVQIFGLVCAALGPSIFKKMQSTMESEVVVMYLMLSGSIAMLALALRLDNFQKENLFKLSRGWVPISIIFAAFFGSLYYCLFIHAMMISSVAETSLVARFSPVIIAILSVYILGEVVTSWVGFLIGAGVCLSSLFVQYGIAGLSRTINPFLPFALVAMLAHALMFVSERYALKYSSRSLKCTITGIKMLCGALMMATWVIGNKYSLSFSGNSSEIFLSLGYAIILGVVTVAGFTFWGFQAEQLWSNTGALGMLLYFSPLFAASWAWIILGEEKLSWLEVGSMFSVASVGILISTYFMEGSYVREKTGLFLLKIRQRQKLFRK
ncbi:MAG: DMT family transporter [Candidatus Moranbacteria bacterium]|nr:DMT family transporter [Candidatus Moranbacteria bacterium]